MAAIPSSDTYLSHRMRLLVVEDDPMIGKALVQGLGRAGFVVDLASDGAMAELALLHDVYELVVLDLGLPSKDGMALLQGLRDKGRQVPVIIATARDAVAQRIEGLNAGADDYLVKPFDLDELVARVRALLRRHAGNGSNILRAGSLCYDTVRKQVTRDGEEIHLSSRELSLLEILMRRPGAVISRDKLESLLYGWEDDIGSNAVEVHLHNLRRKLGPGIIVNVRGVGYRVAD